MHEADADADQRIDQPLAQLDQVLDQRRLGGLDLVMAVGLPGAGPARRQCRACPASGFSPQAPLFSAGRRGSSAVWVAGVALGRVRARASPACEPFRLLVSMAGGRRRDRHAVGIVGERVGRRLGRRVDRCVDALARLVEAALHASARWPARTLPSPARCSRRLFSAAASSDSRMASSNCARNSFACPRTMPTYLPIVRSSAGKSFGPMTSNATMPSNRSLLEVMSNIGYPVADSLAASPLQANDKGAPAHTERRPVARRHQPTLLTCGVCAGAGVVAGLTAALSMARRLVLLEGVRGRLGGRRPPPSCLS